jgi:hypothetical protein
MRPLPRKGSSNSRVLRQAILSCSLLAAPTAAQAAESASKTVIGPQLHAAIASSDFRSNTPAIAWLCDEYLPSLPQWPEGLNPHESYSLSLSLAGLTIQATEVDLPQNAVAIGSFSFEAASEDPPLIWRCDPNGREQWYIPSGFYMPNQWQRLLHAIEADLVDTPRTLAIAVLAGHLAGAQLDNNPQSSLVRLAPALCGDATWIAWQQDNYTRVCGRSAGGLVLPLTLLVLAIEGNGRNLSALSLRAFASRDADQAEAGRQLGRPDKELDVHTLRSLLHAGDKVRLAAIEALIRHGDTSSLPLIIGAADATKPWAVIAARDAVIRLWPITSEQDRHATRAALRKSDVPVLKNLDTNSLPTSPVTPRDSNLTNELATSQNASNPRRNALIILFFMSVGLLALWSRERTLLQRATS